MSEEQQEQSGGGEPPAAQQQASQLAERVGQNIKSLGMQDKVVLIGSGVMLLLSFFRWYGNDYGGANGWEDYHILGMLACAGALGVTALKLDNPPWLQLALAGGAWVLGPFSYWLHFDSPEAELPPGEMGRAMSKMMEGVMPGHTFMFWLAFLAGLAAAGAAGWKFWEAHQRQGGA